MPSVDEEKYKKMVGTIEEMDKIYSLWEYHFKELSEFLLPRRYSSLYPSKEGQAVDGSKWVSSNIVDGVATRALQRAAAGMHGALTSPARLWFRLKFSGLSAGEEESQPDRKMLDNLELDVADVLSRSNFYSVMPSLYEDILCFGSGCFLVFEGDKDLLRFQFCPVGEFRVEQDVRRRVSNFCRSISMTAEQLVEEFGEANCSQTVVELWKQRTGGQFKRFSVRHLIWPDPEGNGFEEVYFEKAQPEVGKKLLRRSRSSFQPMFVSRWKLHGNEPYGISPGMEVLPDVISLQQLVLKKAQVVDLMADPPVGYDSQIMDYPTITPGARIAMQNMASPGMSVLYQNPRPPINELSQDIAEFHRAIREGFYNDLFEMISRLDTVRSATEIDARESEKLILLGPVVGMFGEEILQPLIKLVTSRVIKEKDYTIPPKGDGEDGEIEVVFENIFVAAQRALPAGAMERFMQIVGSMASVFPEASMVLNSEEFVREYAVKLNVPAGALNSRDEVAARKAQLEQAQQQEQESARLNDVAQTHRTLAQTQPQGGVVP